MVVEDKVLTRTLKIENGRLLRNVEDVSAIKKYIQILSEKGYIDKNVISTSIFSEDEKIIEHQILKYIIHSGEYTESMAYDINLLSIKMALDVIDSKIYAYDLLPHNFTFYNGNWFLYDFDSFSISPKKTITEIRGFFKIIFSNYEILRLINREKLGHYYLTRYRIEDIFSIIPLHRWIYLSFNQIICNLLYKLKLYKFSLWYIKNLFKKYSKKHIKNYYKYVPDEKYKVLNNILNSESVTCAFCVGEESANWAIANEKSDTSIQKLVYVDDYNLCDDYYNFIVQNEFKNIIPAVLYPLVDDDAIPINYEYRALYDSYAQERFYSDCVIALNFVDDNKKDLFENLAFFTSNLLILSRENYTQEEIGYLKTLFYEVKETDSFIIAKGKRKNTIPKASRAYKDGNRGPDAIRQSKIVRNMIKS